LRSIISSLFFLCCIYSLNAQDSLYARKLLCELSSTQYHGRGYVQNGDGKAADFLVAEFKKNGLQPLNGSYTQPFTFPVNVITKTPKLCINGKKLVAGRDFICGADAPSGKGKYKALNITASPSEMAFIDNPEKYVLYVDIQKGIPDSNTAHTRLWKLRPIHSPAYVFAEDKLTWTARTKQNTEPGFNVLKSALPENVAEVKYNVQSKLIQHQARNVMGVVPGVYADSFIFVTAHYDHLGRMGDILFPGANDNASGVSMMMDLARTFANSKEKPKYTMFFIAFAGEEAGLIGSEHMANHPPVPLSNIRFLLNLDLMGSGDEGMMVVNGLKFTDEFAILDSLNNTGKYITNLGKRGEAKNSDHYHFTEKGVHSFFCFTLGGSKAYHDIYDRCENITLSRYTEVFSLLQNFMRAL
jgi:aminopeptidase YwaD